MIDVNRAAIVTVVIDRHIQSDHKHLKSLAFSQVDVGYLYRYFDNVNQRLNHRYQVSMTPALTLVQNTVYQLLKGQEVSHQFYAVPPYKNVDLSNIYTVQKLCDSLQVDAVIKVTVQYTLQQGIQSSSFIVAAIFEVYSRHGEVQKFKKIGSFSQEGTGYNGDVYLRLFHQSMTHLLNTL